MKNYETLKIVLDKNVTVTTKAYAQENLYKCNLEQDI
jgi:hypothetical protein